MVVKSKIRSGQWERQICLKENKAMSSCFQRKPAERKFLEKMLTTHFCTNLYCIIEYKNVSICKLHVQTELINKKHFDFQKARKSITFFAINTAKQILAAETLEREKR